MTNVSKKNQVIQYIPENVDFTAHPKTFNSMKELWAIDFLHDWTRHHRFKRFAWLEPNVLMAELHGGGYMQAAYMLERPEVQLRSGQWAPIPDWKPN